MALGVESGGLDWFVFFVLPLLISIVVTLLINRKLKTEKRFLRISLFIVILVVLFILLYWIFSLIGFVA